MANSALIDDLLKQFADNPRRVFARLANEYRKRGELDSAIEICRSHVPLQPGYISGHIVLGQALYDSGSLDEARASFETALALDPENLIALRHMGDIASANGDVESARGWYGQLLEIDPQNEEVAAQLESLGAPIQTESSGPSVDTEVMAGWGEVSPEAIDLAAEEVTFSELEPVAEAAHEMEGPNAVASAPTTDDALALDEIFDFAVSTTADDEATADPPIAAVEGLESTSFQSAEGVDSSPLDLVELDELTSEAADAAESSEEPAEAVQVQGAVAPLFPADTDTYDFSDADASEDDSAPTAFATETMAELYLQQGFPDRALAIYRELAVRDPDDASLRERIAELTEPNEAAPAAPMSEDRVRTAREFFGVLAYRQPPRAASPDLTPEPAVASIDAAGAPPADDRDAPMLESDAQPEAAGHTAEPAPADAAPAASVVEARNGKPGHEAASALSLDDVFRDAPVTDSTGSRKGLSFDEFFARRGNGAAEQSTGTVATGSDSGAPDEDHADDDEPQDLALFHAWLDGLKS